MYRSVQNFKSILNAAVRLGMSQCVLEFNHICFQIQLINLTIYIDKKQRVQMYNGVNRAKLIW